MLKGLPKEPLVLSILTTRINSSSLPQTSRPPSRGSGFPGLLPFLPLGQNLLGHPCYSCPLFHSVLLLSQRTISVSAAVVATTQDRAKADCLAEWKFPSFFSPFVACVLAPLSCPAFPFASSPPSTPP